jgi:hypothetical protein
MHRQLRSGTHTHFELELIKRTPRTDDESTRDGKHKFAEFGDRLLVKGREALGNRAYAEALMVLTCAQRAILESMKPGMRWDPNTPFQVISNRAMAAERLCAWNLCRHDTRLTLFLKNDHMRSYDRLPLLAEKFLAFQLKEELVRFVAEIKKAPPATTGGWRAAARTAIALISITGIMASLAGSLTPELREELERVGIDDMYTPVNVGADVLDYLPWLGEEHCESL